MFWKLAFTGIAALVLFSVGGVLMRDESSSLAGMLTDSIPLANFAGTVASVLLGLLLAWPFLMGFRATLRGGKREEDAKKDTENSAGNEQ